MTESLTDPKRLVARSASKRQVSVLFTDMVGYTAIVDSLGEDEALAFTQAIYQEMKRTVQNHGGTVRGFAGDSIMGLFGIPDAQEDAALRACRAALALQSTFSDAADNFEKRFNVRPEMRVGVSSGLAVMAAVEGEDSPITAVGSTVNLASRIQSMAPTGGCLICDSTRRLIQWVAEINFEGERQIKGLKVPQKLWQLESLHASTRRFDASIAKGLSHFVGRDEELSKLNDLYKAIGESGQWVDIVAEAGLGKTRLIFEFLEGLRKYGGGVLRGHCISDGKSTPLLPFKEIIRRSFNLRESYDREETIEHIRDGLQIWSLETDENVSLILNLIGISPLKQGFEGLDGVLVGLRTRDLIRELLVKQADEKPLTLILEDVHWIDEASEALLGDLARNSTLLKMLIITTRRPEHTPVWADQTHINLLSLEPLSNPAICKLARSWLDVEMLPNELVVRLTERAGGNPLFGEELLTFLVEEGAIEIDESQARLNHDLVFNELPASMQSLITARLEQLPADDFAIIETASAIGRRFDPALLAQVTGDMDRTRDTLRRLTKQDILQRDTNASDYEFRHSLVRETLYTAMVSDRQRELHLTIAKVIEDRNSSSLSEVADQLAFHYSKTDETLKAFEYTSMAATKSMRTFALVEANQYFDTAYEFLQKDSRCLGSDAFSNFVADFALCANLSLRINTLIERAEILRPLLEEHGSPRAFALFLHHLIYCLVCHGDYRRSVATTRELADFASSHDDRIIKAYSLVSQLSVSNFRDPLSNKTYKAMTTKAETMLAQMDDAYLHNFFHAQVLWNQISRGHVSKAMAKAENLLEFGRTQNDPRSLGYGLAMKALIAMLGGDYEKALAISEEAIEASRTEYDTTSARASKITALIATEADGAIEKADTYLASCEHEGLGLFKAGPEAMYGMGLAIRGELGAGIVHIEDAIKRRAAEGYQSGASWTRLYLCEVYLAILSGEGDTSIRMLARNAKTILRVILSGEKRILSEIEHIRNCPQFDPNGHYIAHCELIQGLLHKIKKRHDKALIHLNNSLKIIAPAGSSAMLTRIETAISELSASKVQPNI